MDHDIKKVVVVTNDIIQNMLHRDGPMVRKSFDRLTRTDVAECSELLGQVLSQVVRHLARIDDEGYKATVSRLLNSAGTTYLASIEVGRSGFRRQYGALVRTFIELIATIIVIGIKPKALEQFHEGKLKSTDCIGPAKAVIETIGQYYGLMNQFVHITPNHALLESPRPYTSDDTALHFIIASMRSNVWFLYLATELSYHDEMANRRYWKDQGGGVVFDPSPDELAWMDQFLVSPDELADSLNP